MKKEIYITILLFAFMLFALISTVVRGKQKFSDGSNGSPGATIIVGPEKPVTQIGKTNYNHCVTTKDFLNRGLQVVNWSGRSLFAPLRSRAST